MTDTPTAEIDPADVRSFIEMVSADDRVLFNDRSRPLTVNRVHTGGTAFTSWEYAEIEGPRGGVYQIRWEQHRDSEPSVHIRRHTGYNDDGFRTWDEGKLTHVQIVDHFELAIGQVFVSHGEKLTHYEVVTGFSDKQTGDAQTIDVRVRDGEVRGVRESCVFNSIIKERLFDDYVEHDRTLPIGYRKTTGQFHDAETDQAVYLSDGHKRGVDVRPVDGSGLDVVGWETILLGFADRITPLDDDGDDGDEPELVTDGGHDTEYTEFVLAGCTKSKRDGVHLARDLYDESPTFRKRRRFAHEFAASHDAWGILSAKYGFLRPWDIVPTYDTHISERTDVWAAFVLDDLLDALAYHDVDQVTILAGSKYVQPLVTPLEAHGYDVLDFNNGLMPGERMAALDAAVEEGR